MSVPSLSSNSRLGDYLEYVGFAEADAEALRTLQPRLAEVSLEIVDRFYDRILRVDELRGLFSGPEQVRTLRDSMSGWLRSLLAGPWDEEYARSRTAIGRRHVQVDLPQSYVPLAMFHLRDGLTDLATRCHPADNAARHQAIVALDKILQVELALMTESYVEFHTAELRRAERLATLGQLAASVSHELRNPLGVINTSLHLMRKAAADQPDCELALSRHFDRIERASRHAGSMADQLLGFAKRRSPQRQAVAIRELLDDAVRMVDDHAGSRICCAALPDDARAEVDPDLLGQALANLIRNSVQALQESGRAGTVVVTATQEPSSLRIVVEDDGPGLTPDLLERASEPLYSTKAFGTGLGLPIAQDIIEQHGGSLHIGNADNGGARVVIELPGTA